MRSSVVSMRPDAVRVPMSPQVPTKRRRRDVAANRPRPLLARDANEVWAWDFVFDPCANGQQLKCLTVIDEYTRR